MAINFKMNKSLTQLTQGRLIAGTHDGSSHLDDAVAGAILQMVNPDVEIVRSRDPQVLANCDLRFDVGFKYNIETGDYDHHQKEGAGKRENRIPYASAGLIWKHFGTIVADDSEVHSLVDQRFIQTIDGIDTGVIKPNGNYGLFELNRGFVGLADRKIISHDQAYHEVSNLMQRILFNEISGAQAQVKDNVLMRHAIKEQSGKPYAILPGDISWEPVAVNETNLSYVIIPKKGQFNIRTVPTQVGGFDPRHPLPSAWRGLKDADLQRATGIEGAVFCHNGGFIAATNSLESAEAFTKKAYELTGGAA